MSTCLPKQMEIELQQQVVSRIERSLVSHTQFNGCRDQSSPSEPMNGITKCQHNRIMQVCFGGIKSHLGNHNEYFILYDHLQVDERWVCACAQMVDSRSPTARDLILRSLDWLKLFLSNFFRACSSVGLVSQEELPSQH